MYVYACACVYVFVCMYIHLYMNVYVYLFIGCESQYQCLCVLGGVMNARVCSCVYECVYICVCVYMYVHFFAVSHVCTLEQVFWALVHGPGCTLHRCFFYNYVHICEHTRYRLCTYVYMHAYVYLYVYASMILLDTLRHCY